MYMPLMVDLHRVVIFAGERGEGLQKTEKLAVFADELLVVPETSGAPSEIHLPEGPLNRVPESLSLGSPRRIPVAPDPASRESIPDHLDGATFVTSDLADEGLNRFLFEQCQQRNILCNVIDVKELCNTWLMSVIDTPNMLAGLSTRGGCAFYAQRTRIELEEEFDRRSEVSRVLTRLRARLRDDRCNFCVLDIIYRDRRFQNHLNQGNWEEALARGEQLSVVLPPDIHVRDHGVEGIDPDPRMADTSR